MRCVITVNHRMSLEMTGTLFRAEAEEGGIVQFLRFLHSKVRTFCLDYVKTKLLTKKNLKNYYAGHLKGLPSNL